MAMKCFISWSGERSRKLAQTLHKWIPKVIQDVDPWMSDEDLDKGSHWRTELAGQLDKTSFGLICLTPENQTEPWIIFEAGALSKQVEHTRVCPYLLALDPSEIRGPLAQFQVTKAEKEDTRKLIHSINKAVEQHKGVFLKEPELDEAFNKWWPDLDRIIRDIPPPTHGTARPKRKEHDILEEILDIVRGLDRSSTTLGPRLPVGQIRSEALREILVKAGVVTLSGGLSELETDKPSKK